MRTRTTAWVAGTALLCVLLFAATWLLLIGPRRAEESDLRVQRVASERQNEQLKVKIAGLRAESAELPDWKRELSAFSAQFPAEMQLPKLVRDLNEMADSAGVDLLSVIPSSPTAMGGQGGSTAPPQGAGSGGAASLAASPLLGVLVTLRISGDYFEAATFVKQLQTQPRVILISKVELATAAQSDGSAGGVEATITGQVFVLPKSSVIPGAVSGSSAGTSAVGGNS